MPAFSVFLGSLVLAAFWIGGSPWSGVISFALLAVFGALFLVGRRSETISGLGGPGRDERWALIDTTATAFSGVVVISVLIGAWLYDIARGGDGSPYGQLMAVAGIAYLVGVAILRFRS
jgi:hypothetical protein